MLSFVVLCRDHKARVKPSPSIFICAMTVMAVVMVVMTVMTMAMTVAVLVLLPLLFFTTERRDSFLCQRRRDHAHLGHRHRHPRDHSTRQNNSTRPVFCINVPVPTFLG